MPLQFLHSYSRSETSALRSQGKKKKNVLREQRVNMHRLGNGRNVFETCTMAQQPGHFSVLQNTIKLFKGFPQTWLVNAETHSMDVMRRSWRTITPFPSSFIFPFFFLFKMHDFHCSRWTAKHPLIHAVTFLLSPGACAVRNYSRLKLDRWNNEPGTYPCTRFHVILNTLPSADKTAVLTETFSLGRLE